MSSFDPYHKWLGIPKAEQPPHHYRLLGIAPFESDLDVIEAAADRQMSYIRQCATGPYTKESQQILNELSAARVCLLSPEKKKAYDGELKVRLVPAAGPSQTSLAVSRPRVTRIPAQRQRAPDADDVEEYPLIQLQQSVAEGDVVLPRRRSRRKASQSNAYWLWGGVGGIGLLLVWGLIQLGGQSHDEVPQSGENAEIASGQVTAVKSPEPAGNPRGQNRAGAASAAGPGDAAQKSSPDSRAGFGLLPGEANELDAADTIAASPGETTGPSPGDAFTGEREARAGDPPLPTDEQPVEEVKAPAADDLLKRIALERNTVRGTWRWDGKALVSPATNFALLQIPVSPPAEYVLRATVEATSISDCLCLGLVTGSRQVTVVLNGWQNTTSGLQLVNFQMVPTNETKTGPVLRAGTPNEIVCTVNKGRIEVTCNGKPFVRWTGDFNRLLAGPDWEPPNKNQLYLGTNLTAYRISKLELEPLTKSSRVSKATSANPTQSKLKVLSARYESAAARVDLTDRLQKAAQDGLLVVFVEPVLSGGKFTGDLFLRVQNGTKPAAEQRHGNRSLIFMDVRPPEKTASRGLVVLDALYGTGIWTEGEMVDVRDVLKSHVKNDQVRVSVKDLVAKIPDPSPGKSKVLIVRYKLDKATAIRKIEEHETLELGRP